MKKSRLPGNAGKRNRDYGGSHWAGAILWDRLKEARDELETPDFTPAVYDAMGHVFDADLRCYGCRFGYHEHAAAPMPCPEATRIREVMALDTGRKRHRPKQEVFTRLRAVGSDEA